jgi:hypothetical protein
MQLFEEHDTLCKSRVQDYLRHMIGRLKMKLLSNVNFEDRNNLLKDMIHMDCDELIGAWKIFHPKNK